MPKHLFKKSGIIRTGFEYQDLIGIELLIEFFRDPDRYHWVELESDGADYGYLDDVVAERTDGTFEVIQVKFTVDPERLFLDWDWLLKKSPNGTSFLRKWSDSLIKVAGLGPVHSVQLRTNRKPDEEFAKALNGKIVDLELVSNERKQTIEVELGRLDIAKDFFARFEFCHSEQLIDNLEIKLKGSIVPTDTDTNGWLLLREQARIWATRKNQPEPTGRILHQHLVQIITKKRAHPIPQNFKIPDIYCLPNRLFHTDFIQQIKRPDNSISVLWGSPGRGKSTYLSYLIEELRKEDLPVIRHHYFLSPSDFSIDRVSLPDIASSLIDQIIEHYPEAVRGLTLENISNQLPKYIEACGNHYANEGKRFFIVIDGLDHVWREQGNIINMDHLFNYLLPCPKNVTLIVGTQRVPDNQLPNRLIQHVNDADWIEIPVMDEAAVHEWVNGQYDAGRIILRDKAYYADSEAEGLGTLGRAFFEITHGHPLHLIYSFESLVRRGTVFTDGEIRSLPTCPDGDIRKYYNGLWQRLSANAKQIMHLIAGSDFHWPSDGIRWCVGPIDEVDHLLEHRRSGLMPFHGSILAYARERSEHEATFLALLPKTVNWLKKEAPEFWRWGWLWLMKANKGDYTELLNNTTRQWVIESLAQGWPYNQIITILSEAELKAFQDGNYSRTIELRSLKTRVQNGPEFQMENYSQFQEIAIRVAGNTQQIRNLADEITTLSEEQILTLARTTSDDTVDILNECFEELRQRVNLWLNLRHRPGAEFMSLAKHYIEVLALGSEIKVKGIIQFVRGFQKRDEMFGWLLNCLTRERRFDTLGAVACNLKKNRNQHWRLTTENSMIRVAALEGINIASRYRIGRSVVSPFMVCWFHVHKASNQPKAAKLRIPKDIVRDRYNYGRNRDVESFFYNIFFSALAAALTDRSESSFEIPVTGAPASKWIHEIVKLLEEMAQSIAKRQLQLSFSTPFYASKDIKPITGVNPSDPVSRLYHSFKHELRQIAVDLHLLKCSSSETHLIGPSELEIARSSPHWSEEAWITEQVENRFQLLDPDAANETLEVAKEKEISSITVFNERAENWTELARFALLYENSQAPELILRAANCIVGYGWRKDDWIFDILESIAEVHKHGAADALPWLRSLVPIVEQITEFTDGDETNHARSKLIDVVATVCPDRLPDFYAHHISQDEFAFADDTLDAHCKLIDFSSPVSVALAHTFVEKRNVAILGTLRNAGNIEAGRVEAEQVHFLGGMPPNRDLPINNNEDVGRRGTPPDITQFGPSDFPALLMGTSDHTLGYENQHEALKRWLYHWKDKGMGFQALASIRSYFENEENPYSAESLLDEVFLVSLEIEGKRAAYSWLVMAHIHRNGWQSYYTSPDEVLRRLEWVSKHYKSKWAEFIFDTSKPSRYWQKRKYGFAIGSKYLVHFLLMVGQKEMAARFTDTCVRILISEVSDQPIPECPWFL